MAILPGLMKIVFEGEVKEFGDRDDLQVLQVEYFTIFLLLRRVEDYGLQLYFWRF